MTRQAVGLGRVAKPTRPAIPNHASARQRLGRPLPNLGPDTPCQDPASNPAWWFAPEQSEWFDEQGQRHTVFVTTREDAERAKTLCRTGCAKREACLAWAIVVREPEGIYGGMDPQERRRVWARGGGS